MNIEIIAQNAIRVTTNDNKVIYFDPFKLTEKYSNDADVIFVTHAHFDHFSPEDINRIKKDNTVIVVTNDLYEKSINIGFDENKILKVMPNNSYNFAGINFTTIPAYNTNKDFHKREFNWVSYILEIDGNIIYVAGDTDITEEALNVKCDIALVPVGGTYTMTAEEAAELVVQINPTKYAIPTHYQTIVGSPQDAVRFKNLLDGKRNPSIKQNMYFRILNMQAGLECLVHCFGNGACFIVAVAHDRYAGLCTGMSELIYQFKVRPDAHCE